MQKVEEEEFKEKIAKAKIAKGEENVV